MSYATYTLGLPSDVWLRCRTGYENIREVTKKTFGAEAIDMTSEVWGLDEEGELRGSYRPTGHPGVSTNLRRREQITDTSGWWL